MPLGDHPVRSREDAPEYQAELAEMGAKVVELIRKNLDGEKQFVAMLGIVAKVELPEIVELQKKNPAAKMRGKSTILSFLKSTREWLIQELFDRPTNG